MRDTATGKKPLKGNHGSVNHEINAAVFKKKKKKKKKEKKERYLV